MKVSRFYFPFLPEFGKFQARTLSRVLAMSFPMRFSFGIFFRIFLNLPALKCRTELNRYSIFTLYQLCLYDGLGDVVGAVSVEPVLYLQSDSGILG